MSRSHSFSVEVAKNFKVDIALLLQHFSFWYLKNKSDNVNLFKNDYWVRMKADTLVEYFPYFTKRQLRYCIDKMIDLDLLKQDQFNDKSNDRTKWYSLTKTAKNILNISTDKIVTPNPFLSDKIVTPSDKIVTSIYKEVDIEDRYRIYIDFSAINFIIKNAKDRFEVFEMQYKKTIPDYIFFLKYYETKVQEEELPFTVNKLLGRLNRLALNWNTSSSKNNYSNTAITPLTKPKRLN